MDEDLVTGSIFIRVGKECDGGGGERPGVATSLHHRQKRPEYRTDHAAAATSKGDCDDGLKERSPILPLK